MASHLLRDPVTGTVTLHRSLEGKPRPMLARHAPDTPGPCPLCKVAGEADNENILEGLGEALCVANKYPVLGTGGPDGDSELVFGPSHVDSFESAEPGTVFDLLALSQDRAAHLDYEWSNVFGFANIGLESGASLEHLHIQVIGTHLPGPLYMDVMGDQERAWAAGLGIGKTAWIPPAPSSGFEVRAYAGPAADWANMCEDIVLVTQAWKKLGRNWAYNIFFHRTPSPWIQLLPRVDYGVGYPQLAGIVVVSMDPQEYASSLRQA